MGSYNDKLYGWTEWLCDSIYNDIISPERLIDNALLPNYHYVKVESNEIGMILTSKCQLDKGTIVKYFYQFDGSKRLLSLRRQIGTEIEELYNRRKKVDSMFEAVKERWGAED